MSELRACFTGINEEPSIFLQLSEEYFIIRDCLLYPTTTTYGDPCPETSSVWKLH